MIPEMFKNEDDKINVFKKMMHAMLTKMIKK